LKVALKNSFVGIRLCERRKVVFLFVERKRKEKKKKRRRVGSRLRIIKWCSRSCKGSTEGWWRVGKGPLWMG
jgi:hypothetical protein